MQQIYLSTKASLVKKNATQTPLFTPKTEGQYVTLEVPFMLSIQIQSTPCGVAL